MRPALQLRLSQHLALTPQLQQSIKRLQLSTVEMQQEIERYLLENPMLERDDEPGGGGHDHGEGDMSLRYAIERKQFGQPIAQFQLVQAMLADSKVDLLTIEALMRSVAARFDAGESVSLECSALKLHASEAVGRIADRAVQIHGGAGYMAEYKVERFYRDVRLLRIYEGTTQIQQTIIARNMIRNAQ